MSLEQQLIQDIGVVIAYGVNSAQNAMMNCTAPNGMEYPQNATTDQNISRRVQERPPQPQRQDWWSLKSERIEGDGISSKHCMNDPLESEARVHEMRWDCIIESQKGLN
jgi:hypothetical protein